MDFSAFAESFLSIDFVFFDPEAEVGVAVESNSSFFLFRWIVAGGLLSSLEGGVGFPYRTGGPFSMARSSVAAEPLPEA